jgi:hypothetical protein
MIKGLAVPEEAPESVPYKNSREVATMTSLNRPDPTQRETSMMKATLTRSVLACLALIVVLGGISAGQRQGQAQEAKPGPREDTAEQRKAIQQAMAEKLKQTHTIVTALAVEDFAQLGDAAQKLKQIGKDTLWKVSPNLTYVKYSAEFVSQADELGRRAKEGDLNGATLSYIRLTINCLECHKFARDNRIFGAKP